MEVDEVLRAPLWLDLAEHMAGADIERGPACGGAADAPRSIDIDRTGVLGGAAVLSRVDAHGGPGFVDGPDRERPGVA